jgi:hypothetical protein
MLGIARQLPAREAFALFCNEPDDNTIQGVWLSSLASGNLTKVYDQKVQYACFSPDGRKILIIVNNHLLTMNNNGSGLDTLLKYDGTQWNWGKMSGADSERNFPRWTTNGIFWASNNRIHRFIPETRQKTVLDLKLSDLGDDCDNRNFNSGGMYYTSRDGLRLWLHHNFTPKPGYINVDTLKSLHCGCRGYTRGGHPFIHFSPDFTTYKVIWHSDWGHGNAFTAEGHNIWVQYGYHRNLSVSLQEGEQYIEIVKRFELEPPTPPLWENRALATAINNDSIIAGRSYLPSSNEPTHCWVWNWRTRELYGEFKQPDAFLPKQRMAQLFDGPLPALNTPFLSAVPTQIGLFIEQNNQPIAPQSVVVTNVGSGTITAVSATITPPTTPWLAARVTQSSGNSQTVELTFDGSKVPTGQVQATLTISASNAPNTLSIPISVLKGSIGAPSSLSAEEAGTEKTQVLLKWVDNASDETGFKIERKNDDGTWVSIRTLPANVLSYTDSSTALNGTYSYRVAAFKTVSGLQYSSAPSSEVTITPSGVPFILITSLRSGQVLKKGSLDTLHWIANQVSQVRVQISFDSYFYEDLTMFGGLYDYEPFWNNFPWQVPDTILSTVYLRVAKYDESVLSPDIKLGIGLVAPVSPLPSTSAPTTQSMLVSSATASLALIPQRHSTTITITDMAGKQVLRNEVSAGVRWVLPHRTMAAGVYFVEAVGVDNKREVRLFKSF